MTGILTCWPFNTSPIPSNVGYKKKIPFDVQTEQGYLHSSSIHPHREIPSRSLLSDLRMVSDRPPTPPRPRPRRRGTRKGTAKDVLPFVPWTPRRRRRRRSACDRGGKRRGRNVRLNMLQHHKLHVAARQNTYATLENFFAKKQCARDGARSKSTHLCPHAPLRRAAASPLRLVHCRPHRAHPCACPPTAAASQLRLVRCRPRHEGSVPLLATWPRLPPGARGRSPERRR